MLVSPNGKIKIRMMWASTVGWVGGYVQYGKNKDKITIVQVNYEEERRMMKVDHMLLIVTGLK